MNEAARNGTLATLGTAIALSLMMTSTTQAQTLTQGVVDVLGSQNEADNPDGELVPVNVSVNTNNQGWYGEYPDDEPSTSGSFAGEMQAYRFFQGSAGSIVDLTSTGDIIGAPVWALATLQDRGGIDIWTTTDPGLDLSSPSTAADYNDSKTLVAGIDSGTGSIDISGLVSGTVYFVYGGYRSVPDIDTTMKDTNGPLPDIDALDISPAVGGNNGEVFLASVDFVSQGGYDTVDWTFTNTSTAGRARFCGIVVTGEPQPPRGTVFIIE